MDKGYFKDYYHYERNHWWFRARSEIIRTYIDKNIAGQKPFRILNVGVATGASTTMLQQFGGVTSLEYDQDCIDFIKDKVDFEIIQGSILELPFADNTFDLVCAFDVIEHVEDDTKAVKELHRVARGGGNVLVTVPAFMNLWSQHDDINHHFRRYTRASLMSVFNTIKEGGIQFASYFNSILFPMIFVARKIGNLKKSNDASLHSDFEKFNPGILNGVLYSIMKSERLFISNQRSFLAGVSIILHWKKK
jgi:SAM-dependent methyltransferase